MFLLQSFDYGIPVDVLINGAEVSEEYAMPLSPFINAFDVTDELGIPLDKFYDFINELEKKGSILQPTWTGPFEQVRKLNK